MHVAIALVTYNLLVHLAPARPAAGRAGGRWSALQGLGLRWARRPPGGVTGLRSGVPRRPGRPPAPGTGTAR